MAQDATEEARRSAEKKKLVPYGTKIVPEKGTMGGCMHTQGILEGMQVWCTLNPRLARTDQHTMLASEWIAAWVGADIQADLSRERAE